jgi:hypothetical protein
MDGAAVPPVHLFREVDHVGLGRFQLSVDTRVPGPQSAGANRVVVEEEVIDWVAKPFRATSQTRTGPRRDKVDVLGTLVQPKVARHGHGL